MEEQNKPPGRSPETAAVVLGLVVVLSAVLRSVIAWQHAVPRLFPDEYIYAALGQSIGHGHLAIRGVSVHFPGILEPVVAAPLWRLFAITTAYHLVQVENAIAVSIAAIPIYAIARSLRLPRWYAVVAASYGLLIPELVLVAYTSSDAVAYPLALTAIAFALRAFDKPTTANQIGFLVFASLATLTRVQYVVLVPAYLIAAVVVERRATWRRHRVALLSLAPVVAIALIGALGYYLQSFRDTHLDAGYVKWFFLQMFLLTLEAGVIMVPGAVATLLRPRTRGELAFAAFAGSLAFLLLAEATQHAADSLQFKERYLFVLLALIPVAFGLYLERGRPGLFIVIGLAAAIGIAAARLPLSEYATATFKSDSQFLSAVSYAQDRIGTANASLAIALVATILAAVAVLFAFRGRLRVPIVAMTFAVVIASSAAATHVDLRAARSLRATLPHELTWVDQAAHGPVTAIATPLSPTAEMVYQLYWNTSIRRELLLGAAAPTDAFSAPRLHIDGRGELEHVSGDVLFHGYGTTARFFNAKSVAHADHFTLWRSKGPARFRFVITGRYWDSWLGVRGRLRAWPHGADAGVRVRFRLSVPRRLTKVARIRLGQSSFTIAPGDSIAVTCDSVRGPLDLAVAGGTTFISGDLRRLSARLTRIAINDHVGRIGQKSDCSVAG